MSGRPAVAAAAGTVAAMRPDVADWYERNTWHTAPWTAAELVVAKGASRIAVVLPALDEEATVGGVITAFRPLVDGPDRLVDEILVMDSGSTDRTAVVATAAGARVVRREDVLGSVAPRPGKGEVMWRALAATDADVIVYVDADLVAVDASLVVALLGPLLTRPGTGLVKAFYDRPLRSAGTGGGAASVTGGGGGRVTELLARPAIAVLAPQLAGVIQPLGGEYAARRSVLQQVPFAAGYAVEIGLLLDVVARFGLDCLAQVDVGVREHRHRDLLSLGETATEVLLALVLRSGSALAATATPVPLVQFEHPPGRSWTPRVRLVEVPERPPMSSAGVGAPELDVGPSRT